MNQYTARPHHDANCGRKTTQRVPPNKAAQNLADRFRKRETAYFQFITSCLAAFVYGDEAMLHATGNPLPDQRNAAARPACEKSPSGVRQR